MKIRPFVVLERLLIKQKSSQIILITVLSIYLLLNISHTWFLGKTVYGDGVFYFSWLHSIVIDRDTHFTNEYDFFKVNQPLTKYSIPGNKYAVGPALFWLPNYLWIHRIMNGSGYELPYQVTMAITSTLYVFIALLLLYRIVRQFFDAHTSLLTVLSISLLTNILFYGSVDPVNSHPFSFFTVVLFLSFLFSKSTNIFFLGIAFGLIGIVRPQDMLVGILLVPILLGHRMLPGIFFKFFLGACLAVLPQLIAWNVLYGTWGSSPYLNGQEGFSLLSPHIVEVLVSSKIGIITYSPIILFSLYGFILPAWPMVLKQYKWYIAIILCLAVYSISSWSSWNQGASYGCRMFIGMLPLVAFPLAVCFTRLTTYLKNCIPLYYLLIGWGFLFTLVLIMLTLYRI